LNEEIVKKKVIGEFGTANREKLGRIVFNDTSKLRKLNKIMWPLISGKIKTLIKGKKKVVIEAAVLIEAGWHKYVDKVVVVKTNKENQMKRLLKVKRYSKQVINNIIKVQTSQSKRLKYADYIVDNNKSLSELNGQVKGIVSELK
jgi:dephospho-CoA kinase